MLNHPRSGVGVPLGNVPTASYGQRLLSLRPNRTAVASAVASATVPSRQRCNVQVHVEANAANSCKRPCRPVSSTEF